MLTTHCADRCNLLDRDVLSSLVQVPHRHRQRHGARHPRPARCRRRRHGQERQRHLGRRREAILRPDFCWLGIGGCSRVVSHLRHDQRRPGECSVASTLASFIKPSHVAWPAGFALHVHGSRERLIKGTRARTHLGWFAAPPSTAPCPVTATIFHSGHGALASPVPVLDAQHRILEVRARLGLLGRGSPRLYRVPTPLILPHPPPAARQDQLGPEPTVPHRSEAREQPLPQ